MEYDAHVRWLETMVKRIVLRSQNNQTKPPLSLTFAEKRPLFDQSFQLKDHLTPEDLVTGAPFAIVVNAIKEIPQSSDNLFSTLLSALASLGYHPAAECSPQSLASGSKEAQVELMKLIEWAVVDKALSIDAILSDLKRLPRSFFVLSEKPSLLDDAMALWLSKFPCSHTLPEVTDLGTEIVQFQHVAFALSRVYPKRIPKDEVNVGPELTDLMITKNWELVTPVLDELMAFVPPRQAIQCEHLIRVFFADVFYATRPASRHFVRAEATPVQGKVKPKENSQKKAGSLSIKHQQPAKAEEASAPAKKGYSEKSIARSPNAHMVREPAEKQEHATHRSGSDGKHRSRGHSSKSNREHGRHGSSRSHSHTKDHSRHHRSRHRSSRDGKHQHDELEEPVKAEPKSDEETGATSAVPKLELKGKISLDRMPGSARPRYCQMFRPEVRKRRMSDETGVDKTNLSDSYVAPLSKQSKRRPRKGLTKNEIQQARERNREEEEKKRQQELAKEMDNPDEGVDTLEQEPVVVLDEDFLGEEEEESDSPTYSSRSVQVWRRHPSHRHRHTSSRSHRSRHSTSRSHRSHTPHSSHSHRSRYGHSRHGRSGSRSRRSSTRGRYEDDYYSDGYDDRSSRRHSRHSPSHRHRRRDSGSSGSSEGHQYSPSKSVPLTSLERFAEEASRFRVVAQQFSREANLFTNAQTQPLRVKELSDLSSETLAMCLQRCSSGDKDITPDDIEKMKNTLIEFAKCHPESQTLDNLYELLRRKYDPLTSKDHIDAVYERLLGLLRKVENDQSSIPRLLITIASNVFNPRVLSDQGSVKNVSSSSSSSSDDSDSEDDQKGVVADTITLTSQECETDRYTTTHQETQTDRGYGTRQIFDVSQTGPYELRDMDLAITDPMMLFQRKDVQMESEDGDSIDPINVNISVRHVPFRRFTSFNRVMPTLRSTTILPNLRVIITMLTFNAMPSPQYDVKRSQLISFLQGYPNDRLMILMTTMGLKMKGVYRMDRSKVTVSKIWGSGPQSISEKDVGTFWKYITGSKTLEPIPTRHYTQTTDALCLKRTLEPRNW